MKKMAMALALGALSVGLTATAQQERWLVGDDILNNMPISTGAIGTVPGTSILLNSGHFEMEFTQNAWWDVNWNLEFYVRDGLIINKNGIVTGNLVEESNLMDEHEHHLKRGHSEVAIVPVPGKCDDEFYVINSGSVYVNNNGQTFHDPKYAVVTRQSINLTADPLSYPDPIPLGFDPRHDQHENDFVTGHVASHIGVTQLYDDKRYLFISEIYELFVFEITSQGINLLHTFTRPDDLSNSGIRSELEILEEEVNGELKITVAAPFYHDEEDGVSGASAGMDLYHFTEVGGDVSLDESYNVELDQNGDFLRIPKGVEFSRSGKYIWITNIKVDQDEANLFNNEPGLVVLERDPNNNDRYTIQHSKHIENTAGNYDDEYRWGFIERDRLGRMWIAGDRRLGYWQTGNNITVGNTFKEQERSADSKYSHASHIYDDNYSYAGWDRRKAKYQARLLPDQVDGEDLRITSSTDVIPDVITICSLPHTYTGQFGYWTFIANPTNGPGYSQIFGLTDQFTISQPGTATVTYTNQYGCQATETVTFYLDPAAAGADFSYSETTSNSTTASITVDALTTFSGASHLWELYFYDNTIPGWTAVSNSTVAGVTSHTWINLSMSSQYRIDHTVTLQNPSICNPSLFEQAYTTTGNKREVVDEAAENGEKFYFELFPNPTTDVAVLNPKSADATGQYTIMDLSGREVLRGSFNGRTEINLHSLAPATYLLSVQGADVQQQVVRLIKH